MEATPAAPPSQPPRQRPNLLANQHLENDRFQRAVKVSLLIHALVFIGGVITHLALPGKPNAYIPSVRVDLVGLPDLKKNDAQKTANADLEKMTQKLNSVDKILKQEAIAAKKKPLEVAKDPDPSAMALKQNDKSKDDRKKHLSSAIDRIKALQAMEESVNKSQAKETAKAPAKGNILSKGSQTSGTETGDINVFVDSLVSRIRENWDLPLWLSKQKFSAKVLLRINSSGGVAQIIFVKESGSEQFDQYVRNTINRSAPFGAPPSDIESDGIMLGFPL